MIVIAPFPTAERNNIKVTLMKCAMATRPYPRPLLRAALMQNRSLWFVQSSVDASPFSFLKVCMSSSSIHLTNYWTSVSMALLAKPFRE